MTVDLDALLYHYFGTEALETLDEAGREACLLPPQSLVADYPAVTLDADNAGRFLSGLRRRGEPGQWGADAPLVQVYGRDPAAFLGSAHVTADELIPQRLLSPVEIDQILHAAVRVAERPPDPVPLAVPEPALAPR